MPRIALGVEYDGTDFVGWQSQRNGRAVEDVLAAAVSTVAAEGVTVHAAGRTDAGVHATGQVVHFDARAPRTSRQWVLGVNSSLPADVAVLWAQPVPDDFDARRSALARSYRYLIHAGAVRPVLNRGRAWWLREGLDCASMTRAAAAWLGEHDFSSFRAAHCQAASPMRRVTRIEIRQAGDFVAFEITANAFLYRMVRNLVGVLAEIGRGRAPAAWAQELLAARDRSRAGPTAPAHGLTLVAVRYAHELSLPHSSRAPAL